MLGELFASGRIADLLLGIMLIEGVVLVLVRRRTGRGPAPLDLACNLAAGACLVLALRAALVGAQWSVVASLLAVAGIAHGLDLWRRLR